MLLRTVFILVIVSLSLFSLSASKIIHKAKYVRVMRETEGKTRLLDGTKFEEYSEKGDDLPPLPLGEEEAVSLNDPRIGHIDKAGGIAVPVDENGKVLRDYEYLLRPITVLIDEGDLEVLAVHNGIMNLFPETTKDEKNESDQVREYNPYPALHDVHPKQELVPMSEVDGNEYDDVVSEPAEPAPNVPELPKPDYLDSGETDDDLKGDDMEDNETESVFAAEDRRDGEIIVPSTIIEKIENEEVEMGESSEKVEERTEEEIEEEGDDKTVNIPNNRVDEVAEENAEIAEKVAERIAEKAEQEAESVGLSDEEVRELANDIRKEVFDKVMNKAADSGEFNSEEDPKDLPVDPNSIVLVPEQPLDFEVPSVEIVESGPQDGVILPDQEITDEELAEIAAEAAGDSEDGVSNPSVPLVRGGRIGGDLPDSSSSLNVFLSFSILFFFYL